MFFRRTIELPRCFGLAVVCVFAMMWTSNASAATINLVSGNGSVGSPDPNVTVTDSCTTLKTNATIVPPYSDSGGYWIDPISGSQWDSVDAGSHGCNGTYQATFMLPANATSPSVSVTELADNSTNVSLNGNQPFITGNVPGQCVRAYDGPPVSGTTTSGFVPGVNTLTFNVDNCYPAAGPNPTGLDFVATVTFAGPDAPLAWPFGDPRRTVVGGTTYHLVVPFIDTDPLANPADDTVDIDWGDGTRASSVGVRQFPLATKNGFFVAVASHTYTFGQPTPALIRVTAHDTGGSTLSSVFTYVALPKAYVIAKQKEKDDAVKRAVQDYLNMDASCKFEALTLFGSGIPAALGKKVLTEILRSLGLASCIHGVIEYFSQLQTADDPPSNNYHTVVRPRPVAAVPISAAVCKHSHDATACHRLIRFAEGYLAAKGREVSVSEATAITLDRYSGALLSSNSGAAVKQRQAYRRYLKVFAVAARKARRAGRALARELRRDGVTVVLSGSTLTQAISDVLNLREIPSAAIQRLERDGLISSPGDAQRQLAQLLATHNPPSKISLTQVLSAG